MASSNFKWFVNIVIGIMCYYPTTIIYGQNERITLIFQAYIDGSDYVHVNLLSNSIYYVHRNYQLPGKWNGANEPTIINGKNWFPSWSGDVSNVFVFRSISSTSATNFNFSGIAPDRGSPPGNITLSQEPMESNNFEAVVLLDDDGPGGPAWYEFSLTWTILNDCERPSGLNVFEITSSKAIVKWQPLKDVLNYTWNITPAPCIGPSTGNATSSIRLTNLLPGTEHVLTLKSNCSKGTSESVSTKFSTKCEPIINQFFFNTTSFRVGWSTESSCNKFSWKITPSALSGPSNGVVTGPAPRISFNGRLKPGLYQIEIRLECKDGLMSDPLIKNIRVCENPSFISTSTTHYANQKGDFVVFWNRPTQKEVHSYFWKISPAPRSGPSESIALRVDNFVNFGQSLEKNKQYTIQVSGLCFDHVYKTGFTEKSFKTDNCKPVKIDVKNVTTNSAIAEWSEVTGATKYYWMLTNRFGSPLYQGMETEPTEVVFTQLQPGTKYEFSVQTNCGLEHSPIEKRSILTPCPNPTISIKHLSSVGATFYFDAKPGITYRWFLSNSPFDGVVAVNQEMVVEIPFGNLFSNRLYTFSLFTYCGENPPRYSFKDVKTPPFNQQPSQKTRIISPQIVKEAGTVASIYPNPSSGKVTVVVTALKQLTTSFLIFDVSGGLVFSKTVYLSVGKNHILLDLSDLTSGNYILYSSDLLIKPTPFEILN